MRRIGLILAVLASMTVMLAVAAVPAMADVRISTNGNNGLFDNDNHGGVVFINGNDDNFFPFNNGFLGQELGNESETGNVDLSFSVQSTGNNSNQCVTPLQFGNTGSNQNAQGVTLFNSPVDNNGIFGFSPFFDVFGTDVDLEGGEFSFTPELNASCNQQVQQSSAASSG